MLFTNYVDLEPFPCNLVRQKRYTGSIFFFRSSTTGIDHVSRRDAHSFRFLFCHRRPRMQTLQISRRLRWRRWHLSTSFCSSWEKNDESWWTSYVVWCPEIWPTTIMSCPITPLFFTCKKAVDRCWRQSAQPLSKCLRTMHVISISRYLIIFWSPFTTVTATTITDLYKIWASTTMGFWP